MARVLCVVVLLLEMLGFYFCRSGRKWEMFIYYTQLSNLIAAVSAFLLIVFGELTWITALRYMSTCMLVMTFLVTIFVLIPMGGSPKDLLWSGSGLFHHILCPTISTFSYVVYEQHSKMIWMPVMVTLVYGLIMLYLNGIRKIDGPYPFFRIRNQSVLATVIWMVVLLVVMGAISLGITMIAR